MEHGSTRHKDREPGTGSQKLFELLSSGHDLLEVIKHEQELLLTYKGLHLLQGRPVSTFLESQLPGNGGHDQLRVGESRQPNEAGTTNEEGAHLGGDRDGETGLANPAWTQQGEQAHLWLFEEGTDLGHLRLSSNQRGGLERQGVVVCVEGLEGRKIGR